MTDLYRISIALVRPENDDRAKTLSQWAASIHNIVEISGRFNMTEIRGTNATRMNVSAAVRDAKLALFFCHGSRTSLLGCEPLVDIDNVANMAGSMIVAVACHSASELAEEALRQGVVAYLGFTDKLAWEPSFSSFFGDAITTGIRVVLDGGTLGDAAQRMHREFAEMELFFKEGDGKRHEHAWICWMSAYWDSGHLSAQGQTDRRLVPMRSVSSP